MLLGSVKTKTIEQFVDHLNKAEKYRALYINIEPAQVARDNVKEALIAIVEELATAIEHQLGQSNIGAHLREMIRMHPITLNLLANALRFICETSRKPIVLFIDEMTLFLGIHFYQSYDKL